MCFGNKNFHRTSNKITKLYKLPEGLNTKKNHINWEIIVKKCNKWNKL